MLSEVEYRARLDLVFLGSGPNWASGGADWNNQMILTLAIQGLVLLPFPHAHAQPPFKHYIEMPAPSVEYNTDKHGRVMTVRNAAWVRSWIVDADWEEHYKPPLKFSFTPLTRTE
jgi:hypothetical protein